MEAERLAKYEAWILELEAREKKLAASRPRYARLFVAIPIVSTLGFVWNPWVGVGTLLTGIMCCAFGFYVVAVRADDYVRELRSMRAEVERLRAPRAEERRVRPGW
jgi:hypothetical protein